MRAAVFYILTILVIAIYGGEISPLIAGLHFTTWIGVVAPSFLAGWVGRTYFLKPFLSKFEPLRQRTAQTWYELAWFLIIGLWFCGFNAVVFDYPLTSSLRVLVVILSMGFFAAIDLGLNRERELLSDKNWGPKQLDENGQFEPFSRMLIVFTVIATAFLTLEIIMVIEADIPEFIAMEKGETDDAMMTIYLELGAIFLVKLLLLLSVVVSFSKNLKLFIANQTSVLKAVSAGELENRVPVMSRNEFGLIASYTNEMIDGLEERNQIREAFGKFVSPQIADRILAESPNGIKLGGSRNHVAILVSDIRSFTSHSETHEPEEIVQDLNAYFSKMVAVVHDCGGVVDKFMGDGMLCVFGLDAPQKAEVSAAKAAQIMLSEVSAMNREAGSDDQIEIGIGVHAGPAISGKIGSPDRLEFTVIGDTVNTAARLESLTKNLNVPVVISDAVYQKLNGDSENWESLGEHELRGKKKPVGVFGLASTDAI